MLGWSWFTHYIEHLYVNFRHTQPAACSYRLAGAQQGIGGGPGSHPGNKNFYPSAGRLDGKQACLDDLSIVEYQAIPGSKQID